MRSIKRKDPAEELVKGCFWAWILIIAGSAVTLFILTLIGIGIFKLIEALT